MATKGTKELLGAILTRYDHIVEKNGEDYAQNMSPYGFLTEDEISYLKEQGIELAYWNFGEYVKSSMGDIIAEVEYLYETPIGT